MRLRIDAMLNYRVFSPVDVLLMLEVAQMHDQIFIDDLLVIDGVGPLSTIAGGSDVGRRSWMHANGPFVVSYRAEIDIIRTAPHFDALTMTPLHLLPPSVIPFLWPSRYCESDRFESFVMRRFSGPTNGAKIAAMAAWIRDNVDYVFGWSTVSTTAVDVFVSRKGVCRDFAHLLASFARAAGVPARLVAAYAWQLEYQDFHAVVEVWLDDAWHLIDATQLAPIEGMVRIGVGRDATDIAFMTVFGNAELIEQRVEVRTVPEIGSSQAAPLSA